MKRLLLIPLLASTAFAAPVTISDTIRYPDNTLASGSVTITWPAFVTAAGGPIAAGSARWTITAGVLNVSLEPNLTAVPSGTSYAVSFVLSRGSYSQRWIVPTSATALTVGDVVTSTVPTPALTIALSQISTTSAVAGDIMYFNGTAWTRLARGTNAQVLTVDTSLAGKLKWGAGSGGAWGTLSGTLSDQTDLATALAAKQNSLGFTAANVANNLSDLASAATARTNLGLGTAATSAASAFAAPGACSSGQYGTATTASGVTCAQVAYSQISSTPTLRYQLVGVGGTSQTARGRLNLIAGTNITLTPADNSGSDSTDITIDASGGSGSGTVNSSTTGKIAYYAADGTAVSGSNCTIDASYVLDCAGGYTSGTGSGKTGKIQFFGATSGSQVWTVPDVAGTPIGYLLPTTNGSSGDALTDNGSATCPTWATGVNNPATCRQLLWVAPSGGGGGATSQGAFASLPGTCTTGDVYFFTDSPIGKARCSATDTWSYFADGLGQVTPPVLANFTKSNGGTSSATNGGITLLAPSSGSLNARVLYETAAYTAPASREACFTNSVLVGTNQQVGIGVMDLAAVKFEFLANAFSAGTFLSHTYWIGYSVSGGSELVTPSGPWAAQLASSPFKCFKVTDDATNLKFYVSTDGRRSWSQFGTSTSRTANMTTPDHFVFIVQNSNSMDTYGTVFHWQ